MCVAVVVLDASPRKDELESMEFHNPHGAGIAYATPLGIRYIKGLTAAQIHAVLDFLPRPVLMHYRWATHGPKTPLLAHPFPMDERAVLGRELEGYADKVLIHNGVWSSYARHMPDWVKPLEKLISDTAVAALVAKDNEKILDDISWATAVGYMNDEGEMDVRTRGRWMEHEGNWYSNLQWRYTSGRGEGKEKKEKRKKSGGKLHTVSPSSSSNSNSYTSSSPSSVGRYSKGYWDSSEGKWVPWTDVS